MIRYREEIIKVFENVNIVCSGIFSREKKYKFDFIVFFKIGFYFSSFAS